MVTYSVPIPVKVGFAYEFLEFSIGCTTTWKQWQALELPGGKKLRLSSIHMVLDLSLSLSCDYGFDKFIWVGTHTPYKSKCHKVSLRFMKMMVRKHFH